MTLLTQLARYMALFLIGGYVAAVGWKLFSGSINLDGLLDTSESGTREYSPARLQLLAATVLVAAQYLGLVWRDSNQNTLPTPNLAVLALLGGSNGIYLAAKGLGAIRPFLKSVK